MESEHWRDPGTDLTSESELRNLTDSVPEGENPYGYLVANAGLRSAAGPKVDRDHVGDAWLGTGGWQPAAFRPART